MEISGLIILFIVVDIWWVYWLVIVFGDIVYYFVIGVG